MDNQNILEELYRAKNLVVNLAKEIDVKNKKLLEMEFKLDEVSEALAKLQAENRRLYQDNIEIGKLKRFVRMGFDVLPKKKKRRLASESSEELLQKFESFKNERAIKVKRLVKCEAPDDLKRENLMLEKEQLKAQSPVGSNYELIDQLHNLRKELDEKLDEFQCMDSLNQTLKERMSNVELQHTRKELINGLQDFWNSQTNIGIRRMGEVSAEPIKDACMKKFPGDWKMKSTELCSLGQDLIPDPEWYPFKRQLTDGKYQEVINFDDVILKELRSEWGNEVCKAVSNALLELNEYNGGGIYVVLELWNFKEGRKSSLKKAVECIIQELKTQKSHKHRR